MATVDLARKNQYSESPLGQFSQGAVFRHLLVCACFGFSVYYIHRELGGLQSEVFPFFLIFFGLLVVMNPIYGVMGLVMAIGLSPDSVGYNNVRLEDYMIPPLLVIGYLKMKSKGGDPVTSDVWTSVRIYMIICAFASVKGIMMGTVWTSMMALQFYFKYVEYFLIMWLMIQVIHKREDLIFIVVTSLLVCALVAFIAYTNRAEVVSQFENRFVRAGGPQGETPNVLGGYYLVHIMLAFALVFSVKNYIYKALLVTFLMAVVMPLLYTYSRTSFTSVVVGLLVTCLFIDLRYIFIILALVFLNQLLLPQLNNSVIVDESFVDRYSTIFEIFDDDDKPSSWTARMTGWYIFYVRTWNSDPFFGRGIGSVGLGIDSSFVKKFVESGIFGLFAFVMFLVRLARMGLEVAKEELDHLKRGVAIGYLGILVGMSVHAIGVSSFSTIRTAEPFFLFSGVMVGLYVRMKRTQERKEEDQKEQEELSFNAR